ncbi:MAG: 4-hydroxythreonine-4-phosphate dehydrogenase PdxA [Bacteroidales bacterium]|jgi:4-hydroxythreonine-4-phosphate dehydrogenase|nr:4-hydroxythreonine-4-phosphate dehydrogenase PdxA [Bacteroidales bacterium]
MKHNKIILGISHGDVNGISYEIIIKTLKDNRILDFCTPIVYGSPKVAAYHRKALNIQNFSLNNIKTPEEANPKRSNIINCIDDNIRVELGKSTSSAGESSFMALERAVEDLKNKKIDVLVTAPINKDNIQSKEFKFPGHTEYLANSVNSKDVLMLMVSENLKVGVVAGHVPIKDVPAEITKENILKKLRIMNQSLIQDFRIRKPKIAVMGLNPHAGDNGLLGDEEKEIITPAINQAKEENIMAIGPYSADGFFGSDSFKKFDAILSMYHDQGLVPFKALAFNSGVNYTAGLEIIRTSPGHGTAYEIAGMDKATPDSFRQAIYLACDIYKNRMEYFEISKNPLKSHKLDS